MNENAIKEQSEKFVIHYEKLVSDKIISPPPPKEAIQIQKQPCKWRDDVFEWDENVKNTLQDKFKLEKFHENQLEVINAALSKRDVLAIMPSEQTFVCYQIPATINDGVTVVFKSISDFTQEVNTLRGHNVWAETFVQDANVTTISQFKLFFVHMKDMHSDALAKCLQEAHETNSISRFVIHDANCISSWGQNYLPDLHKNSQHTFDYLRRRYPTVPILAVTTPTNPEARKGIADHLLLDDTQLVQLCGELFHPELYFDVTVQVAKKKTDVVLSQLNKCKDGKSIIYCHHKEECLNLFNSLKKCNIQCEVYHPELSDREANKEKWINASTSTMVSTFDFSTNHPIRNIIHYSIPWSMELLYQHYSQCDSSNPCSSLMIYDSGDRTTLIKESGDDLKKKVKVNQVVDYAINKHLCRRSYLSCYFGSNDVIRCGNCDNCKDSKVYVDEDFTALAISLLRIIDEHVLSVMTAKSAIDAWQGTKSEQVKKKKDLMNSRDFGHAKNLSQETCNRLLLDLIINGYIEEEVSHMKQNVFLKLSVNGDKFDQLKKEGAQYRIRGATIKQQQQTTKSSPMKRKSTTPKQSPIKSQQEKKPIMMKTQPESIPLIVERTEVQLSKNEISPPSKNVAEFQNASTMMESPPPRLPPRIPATPSPNKTNNTVPAFNSPRRIPIVPPSTQQAHSTQRSSSTQPITTPPPSQAIPPLPPSQSSIPVVPKISRPIVPIVPPRKTSAQITPQQDIVAIPQDTAPPQLPPVPSSKDDPVDVHKSNTPDIDMMIEDFEELTEEDLEQIDDTDRYDKTPKTSIQHTSPPQINKSQYLKKLTCRK
ncbi:ATP-dependent DNA helicase [Acrasis kona]|uniref:DNA 3'-5' helicase n=1 Tax=Acrasis kona TaxID=1008807 RepID=A0AAW2YYL8_9EUKA